MTGTMNNWKSESFQVALIDGATTERTGYTLRGVGLWMDQKAGWNGDSPPVWGVLHLNTGHQIARIAAGRYAAFDLATKIASLGDWDYGGLKGHQNQDPEIFVRLAALGKAHAAIRIVEGAQQEDVARAINRGRMG
jgi:hypothetical protein